MSNWEKEKYAFQDLVDIIEYLRSDNGCPWDREQTHSSMIESLIEESYEVIDAIEKKDEKNLCEELGDLLLHVLFHAQIEKEKQVFNIEEVIDGICKKLIFRHPHVFGESKVDGSEEVLNNWDELKKIEKQYNSHTEILEKIPQKLPALMRAYKIQKKAAKVGFDWEDKEGAIAKSKEEWEEVMEAVNNGEEKEIIEEIGDLIFSIVNLSRFLKVNPEIALTKTIEKFINRFRYIENSAVNQGSRLEELSIQKMDLLWNEAKKFEN